MRLNVVLDNKLTMYSNWDVALDDKIAVRSNVVLDDKGVVSSVFKCRIKRHGSSAISNLASDGKIGVYFI